MINSKNSNGSISQTLDTQRAYFQYKREVALSVSKDVASKYFTLNISQISSISLSPFLTHLIQKSENLAREIAKKSRENITKGTAKRILKELRDIGQPELFGV